MVAGDSTAPAALQVQVHSLCHSNPSGGLIGVLHPGFYPGGPILHLLGRVEGLPYPSAVYLHLHPVSAGWELCSLWYLHLRTSFYLLQTIIILHIPGHNYRIDSYVVSALAAAVVESLADALRDDDDDTLWEKLWNAFGGWDGNLVSDKGTPWE